MLISILRKKIKVPIFLFYLPNKPFPLSQDLDSFKKINLKGFPHFVTNDYLEELSKLFGGNYKTRNNIGI